MKRPVTAASPDCGINIPSLTGSDEPLAPPLPLVLLPPLPLPLVLSPPLPPLLLPHAASANVANRATAAVVNFRIASLLRMPRERAASS